MLSTTAIEANLKTGDWQKLVKTIYNWNAKSEAQRSEVLELETRDWLNKNPDYEFFTYESKNGKYGERIVTFYFKRKAAQTKAKTA